MIRRFDRRGSDEPDDGVVIGKDADDLGPPLDLAVEPFDGAVDFRPMLGGKPMSASTSSSASSMKPASLGSLGLSRSATFCHCALAASALSWAKAVAMKAETTRRLLLPGLPGADVHAEHLAPAVRVDADCHDHRDRDDAVVAANFHVGRVQLDIGPVAFQYAG